MLWRQDAVWTRNQNYLAISRGLTFSKLPWVDTQVYLYEDQHVHKSLNHISEQTVEGSQDGDAGSDVWESDMIQVWHQGGWRFSPLSSCFSLISHPPGLCKVTG